MTEPKKILVIQTAFLGDVVLATSVVEKLKQSFPAAQIDFLLRKGNESLLANHPHLTQVLVWNKQHSKIANLFRIIASVRKSKYDLLVNCQRFFSSGLITALSGAKFTTGFASNPLSFFFSEKHPHQVTWKRGELFHHEVERCVSLIKSFTDTAPQRPHLYPSLEDKRRVEEWISGSPFITISPTSVWFTKQWPKERWVSLIKKVPHRVLLLGGPGDVAFCNWIVEQCPEAEVVNLAGKMTLLQSAEIMRHAVMNFTNDSAPLHLASAMNAPVTAVFCSTIPEFGFGPLSDVSNVVQTMRELDCKPCGLHGFRQCPKGHFHCAEISLDQLVSTIE